MKQAIYCRSALKCWRRVARIDGIRESFQHRIFPLSIYFHLHSEDVFTISCIFARSTIHLFLTRIIFAALFSSSASSFFLSDLEHFRMKEKAGEQYK